MDEQVTWKGQSFTLLVFGGIVFLCSIFFVLGMLVGRGQGKSAAAEPDQVKSAAESAENASSVRGAKPTNSSHESITLGQEADKDFKEEVKEPAPAPSRTPTPEKSAKPTPKAAVSSTPAPPAATPKAASSKAAAPTPVKMIYLQVNAVASDTAAK